MSENQSSPNASNPQLNNQLGNLEGISHLLSNGEPQQSTLPLNFEPMDLWEAVEAAEAAEATEAVKTMEAVETTDAIADKTPPDEPSTAVETGMTVESEITEVKSDQIDSSASAKAAQQSAREHELLALIHDLNECNDTLLSRVAHLENDLHRAQSTLEAQVVQAQAAQDRMSQQVFTEHASAQQVSQNAQQQVAKLVSKLETNEQALSRQQLINENLLTELNNSQERVTQLERECALTSQQHAEEASARLQAETISRDLRSRLQRQQRYTLQFKAALEKSLTVSARPASSLTNGLTTDIARPISFQDPTAESTSVAMPKAQRIMPWASAGVTAAFKGIDPHLETLIRGIGQPTEPALPRSPIESSHQSAASPASAAAPSPEAEAELWEDLARVMTNPDVNSSEIAPVAEAATNVIADATAEIISPEVLNPAEISATTTAIAEELSGAQPSDEGLKAPLEEISVYPITNEAESAEILANSEKVDTAKQQREAIALAESLAAAASRQGDPQVIFTEPSPWGSPLPKNTRAVTTAQGEAVAAPATPVNLAYSAASTADSKLSPLVNPLRSQKKIGSLASVELPTFPNAKVGSFKR